MPRTDARQDLLNMEKQLDERVKNLPIFRLPIRPVFQAFSGLVSTVVHGGLGRKTPPRPAVGAALGSRLSYLVPHLAQCKPMPIGANALDVFTAFHEKDPTGEQLRIAASYAHFCELMPDVHREHFDVSRRAERSFELTHASRYFAEHEMLDTLLSELSIGFLANTRPIPFEQVFALAATAPMMDSKILSEVLRGYIDYYLTNLVEPPVVGEEALRAAIGVSGEEFDVFRAVLLAISTFSIDLSLAIGLRIEESSDDQDKLFGEYLEWLCVFWKEKIVRHLLCGLTKLSESTVDRLLDVFSLNYRSSPPKVAHAGDGFTPPMVRLPEDNILLSPELVRMFLQRRNVLYATQRMDQGRFNDIVSRNLEPELILQIESLIRDRTGWRFFRNVKWNRGEVDILIYDLTDNSSIQCQVKGSIPPQGSRMVRRLEDRVLEGIAQLDRLRAEPTQVIEKLISQLNGSSVLGVTLDSVVTTPACFGTSRVWEKKGGIYFIPLPVIAAVLKDETDRSLTLSRFILRASDYMRQLPNRAAASWRTEVLNVGAESITFPILDIDYKFLDEERRRIWS